MSRKILFQEADFYGASNLVFQEENLPCCYKASWMHGLGPVLFRDKTSSSVLLHYYERDLPIHLVNNSSTVDLLQLEGVDSVAVGMPFIYTDAYSSCNIRRVYKRLFMPSHRIGGKSQKEEYADWLSIIKKYGCDSICVGLNDYKYIKKNNVQFEGVEVLMGAYSADMDSLERVSLMLKSTIEMVTNSSGSHIVYATVSGVNVVIIEEMQERAKKRMKDNSWNQSIINTVPKKIRREFSQHLNKSVVGDVDLLWGSNDDKEKKEYSEFILGVKEKKDINIVAKYLTPVGVFQRAKIIIKLLDGRVRRKIAL